MAAGALLPVNPMSASKPSDKSSDVLAELPEFRLIERLFARHQADDTIVIGVGDDAAVTHLPAAEVGNELATATDLLVEGTHFLPGAPGRSVGHRSLAVNLSDLAAMGALPLWASLGLSIPQIDTAWLEDFAAGFYDLADRTGVRLIGGDTVRGPLLASVTVQGSLPPGQALRRSGAAAGERVYVTGAPGHAAAGRAGQAEFRAAFEYPEPRLRFGAGLRGLATAVIDISDGLHTDLQQLLTASGVGAEVDTNCVPVAELCAAGVDSDRALHYSLFGGEDYELLLTAPSAAEPRLNELADACALRLTCLGEITATPGLCWQGEGSELVNSGHVYRHFEEG